MICVPYRTYIKLDNYKSTITHTFISQHPPTTSSALRPNIYLSSQLSNCHSCSKWAVHFCHYQPKIRPSYMCVVELCYLWTKLKVIFAVHTSEMCTLEDPAIFWPHSKPLLPHICTYWTPSSSPLAVKLLRAAIKSGFVIRSAITSTIRNLEIIWNANLMQQSNFINVF